jgi:hypothetical protein
MVHHGPAGAKEKRNRSVPLLASIMLGLARISQVLAICSGFCVASRHGRFGFHPLAGLP